MRETAVSFGDQRIYASGTCIMFARRVCYFFVRPRRSSLELCVFLGREVKAPQIRRIERPSKSKVRHIIHITHRDQVEAPVTDWLQEAYELADKPPSNNAIERTKSKPRPRQKPTTKRAKSRR